MLYIFDMGGVVLNNCNAAPEMARRLGITEHEFYGYAGCFPLNPHTSPHNQGDIGLLMKGKITVEQFWNNFRERSGFKIESELWYDCFLPETIPGTVQVIKELRRAGKRVVCGTNTSVSHIKKHRERGDYDLFDKVYTSPEMGLIKPTPEFFNYILNAEKVKAQDAFFVDDQKENVLAAERLGLKTCHFTGPESLEPLRKTYLPQ